MTVAKGYNQTEDTYYIDIFFLVAEMMINHLLLAISSTHNWHLLQINVNNIFLHSDLDEEVYMQLLPVFTYTSPNQVCRLHKSLNEIKKVNRQWFSKLSTLLLTLHYKQSNSDKLLFTNQ